MSYLTTNEFRELSTLDVPSQTLPKLIKRAESQIDILTKFRAENFYNASQKNAQIIKTAVVIQVEFLELNGEFTGIYTSESVKIGNYSESGGDSSKVVQHAPALIDLLLPTGLLYAGIGSYGDRWI